ncbi:MAG: XdhC family protein [Pseudomonadota bacterium]
MTLSALIDAFNDLRAARDDAVLATVVRTAGSTYSKAGAQMLIAADGRCHGLISGGCLEGDLAERAAAVRASDLAAVVRYDMRDRDEEDIWGLGLGCDGALDVLLTPLRAADGYAPLARIADAVTERQPTAWALVTASDVKDVAVGSSLTLCAGTVDAHGLPAQLADELAPRAGQALARGQQAEVVVAGGAVNALVCPVPLPPRVLVAGAGPDVVPVLRLAAELGWSMHVVDHRPAYVERLVAEAGADAVHVCRAELADALANAYAREPFDAALVMSHHLAADRDYLRALARTAVPYVGLLGPTARAERLLDDLGDDAGSLRERLYAPVGLDLGERGPHGIALAAVAQLCAVLNGRVGQPMDHTHR